MRDMTAPLARNDDQDLATRAAGGETEAIRALIKRYNQRLFRTARAILRDDAEAEEAVQDAWMKALRGLADFRHESQLSTWLTRVAANEALTRRRRLKRGAEVFVLAESMEPIPMEVPTDVPGAEDPEAQASRAEVRRMVEAKIDDLPEAFRVVFVLRAVEELTVEETAQVLDIPEATVRTRFFRARGLLRESIARQVDFAVEDAFGFAGARCERVTAAVLARLALPA
jgi:RNA polymerase sigma-70 factor (ECF subfamily)